MALALLAFILRAEEGTLSAACGARLSGLGQKSTLLHNDLSDTMTLTGGTLLGLRLLLATFTLAKTADNILGAGKFDCLALIKHL